MIKGAYNYEDLNRVEYAVELLAEMLSNMGYSAAVSVKTDWDHWDIPTVSTMERYIKNLNALRNAVSLFKTITTTPPTSMQHLTFDSANRIERLLQQIEAWIMGIQSSTKYTGEASCGE